MRHFAAELGLSVSSYLMLAALRYGVHLPRALPLAAALQVGVLRKAPASYRRKGQDDEQLLAQVKADFTKQLKPVPSSLIRDRAEKLKALHDEQLLALPPEKGNPDDGELAGLYDFKRDIEEFVDPAEGDTREDLQARIDNLLKVR